MKRSIQLLLLLATLLFWQRADAAIAFVQKSALCSAVSGNLGCTLTGVTLGNYLTSVSWTSINNTNCTVSDGTNTFTVHKTGGNSTFSICIASFGPYASGGSKTVTVTWGGGGGPSGFIVESSGITTLTADVTPAIKTGTTTPASTNSGTTAIADEILFAVVTDSSGANPATLTESAGYTLGQRQLNGASFAVGGGYYQVLTTTQLISDSWTLEGNLNWVGGIISLKGSLATPRQVGAFLVGP